MRSDTFFKKIIKETLEELINIKGENLKYDYDYQDLNIYYKNDCEKVKKLDSKFNSNYTIMIGPSSIYFKLELSEKDIKSPNKYGIELFVDKKEINSKYLTPMGKQRKNTNENDKFLQRLYYRTKSGIFNFETQLLNQIFEKTPKTIQNSLGEYIDNLKISYIENMEKLE